MDQIVTVTPPDPLTPKYHAFGPHALFLSPDHAQFNFSINNNSGTRDYCGGGNLSLSGSWVGAGNNNNHNNNNTSTTSNHGQNNTLSTSGSIDPHQLYGGMVQTSQQGQNNSNQGQNGLNQGYNPASYQTSFSSNQQHELTTTTTTMCDSDEPMLIRQASQYSQHWSQNGHFLKGENGQNFGQNGQNGQNFGLNLRPSDQSKEQLIALRQTGTLPNYIQPYCDYSKLLGADSTANGQQLQQSQLQQSPHPTTTTTFPNHDDRSNNCMVDSPRHSTPQQNSFGANQHQNGQNGRNYGQNDPHSATPSHPFGSLSGFPQSNSTTGYNSGSGGFGMYDGRGSEIKDTPNSRNSSNSTPFGDFRNGFGPRTAFHNCSTDPKSIIDPHFLVYNLIQYLSYTIYQQLSDSEQDLAMVGARSIHGGVVSCSVGGGVGATPTPTQPTINLNAPHPTINTDGTVINTDMAAEKGKGNVQQATQPNKTTSTTTTQPRPTATISATGSHNSARSSGMASVGGSVVGSNVGGTKGQLPSQPKLNWFLSEHLNNSLPPVSAYDLCRPIRCLVTIKHIVPSNHPLVSPRQPQASFSNTQLTNPNHYYSQNAPTHPSNPMGQNNNNVINTTGSITGFPDDILSQGLPPISTDPSLPYSRQFNNSQSNFGQYQHQQQYHTNLHQLPTPSTPPTPNPNPLTTVTDVIIVERTLMHIIRDYFHEVGELLFTLTQLTSIDRTLYSPLLLTTNLTHFITHNPRHFTIQRPFFSNITHQFGSYTSWTPAVQTYLQKLHQHERTFHLQSLIKTHQDPDLDLLVALAPPMSYHIVSQFPPVVIFSQITKLLQNSVCAPPLPLLRSASSGRVVLAHGNGYGYGGFATTALSLSNSAGSGFLPQSNPGSGLSISGNANTNGGNGVGMYQQQQLSNSQQRSSINSSTWCSQPQQPSADCTPSTGNGKGVIVAKAIDEILPSPAPTPTFNNSRHSMETPHFNPHNPPTGSNSALMSDDDNSSGGCGGGNASVPTSTSSTTTTTTTTTNDPSNPHISLYTATSTPATSTSRLQRQPSLTNSAHHSTFGGSIGNNNNNNNHHLRDSTSTNNMNNQPAMTNPAFNALFPRILHLISSDYVHYCQQFRQFSNACILPQAKDGLILSQSTQNFGQNGQNSTPNGSNQTQMTRPAESNAAVVIPLAPPKSGSSNSNNHFGTGGGGDYPSSSTGPTPIPATNTTHGQNMSNNGQNSGSNTGSTMGSGPGQFPSPHNPASITSNDLSNSNPVHGVGIGYDNSPFGTPGQFGTQNGQNVVPNPSAFFSTTQPRLTLDDFNNILLLTKRHIPLKNLLTQVTVRSFAKVQVYLIYGVSVPLQAPFITSLAPLPLPHALPHFLPPSLSPHPQYQAIQMRLGVSGNGSVVGGGNGSVAGVGIETVTTDGFQGVGGGGRVMGHMMNDVVETTTIAPSLPTTTVHSPNHPDPRQIQSFRNPFNTITKHNNDVGLQQQNQLDQQHEQNQLNQQYGPNMNRNSPNPINNLNHNIPNIHTNNPNHNQNQSHQHQMQNNHNYQHIQSTNYPTTLMSHQIPPPATSIEMGETGSILNQVVSMNDIDTTRSQAQFAPFPRPPSVTNLSPHFSQHQSIFHSMQSPSTILNQSQTMVQQQSSGNAQHFQVDPITGLHQTQFRPFSAALSMSMFSGDTTLTYNPRGDDDGMSNSNQVNNNKECACLECMLYTDILPLPPLPCHRSHDGEKETGR
jgi:hypothetical protein